MNKVMCKAQTKSGKPCNARATPNGFCSIHSDPRRAADLGRMSGESRRFQEAQIVLLPPKTAGDLNNAMGQIFSEVCSRRMDLKLGTGLSYIASVLVKTIELSDHEIRLRAMEQMMKSIKSGGTNE
jgi:hypothetical protein